MKLYVVKNKLNFFNIAYDYAVSHKYTLAVISGSGILMLVLIYLAFYIFIMVYESGYIFSVSISLLF
jgi:hypothetical protein